jgi:D-amino-acid dehydrogenase
MLRARTPVGSRGGALLAAGDRPQLLAFGHGHTGLTMAAITGKLIAELAAERPPSLAMAPYRAERF